MQRYYFDHNATTPLRDEVLAALSDALRENHGNASSIHHYGQEAKQKLEAARRHVAALLGSNAKDIVFTSGGTESNNLALFGVTAPGDHVITSTIEHPAILNPCAQLRQNGVDVTFVPPAADGVVSPDDIARAVRPNTKLISVMHANNETGALQPVLAIAEIAHKADALFHCDGVQAAGKFPLNIHESHFDLYSISAHKLNAPKGIGALYVRKGLKLKPQILGGHHERDRRAGTENVPSAVAFGVAAHWWLHHGREEAARLAALRDRMETAVLRTIPDACVNGSRTHRLANTSNIRLDGIEGEAVVIAMDLRGFAISSGSACSSGAVEPSHVLLAMGQSPQEARSSIRISLGYNNTEDQIDALAIALAESVKHLRRISPAYSHA
ncbi:MAG: cysteine desulfurase [Acidobacteria bacterium]|nr:cysteine desulfurase [Acidobacteriota bacterium]